MPRWSFPKGRPLGPLVPPGAAALSWLDGTRPAKAGASPAAAESWRVNPPPFFRPHRRDDGEASTPEPVETAADIIAMLPDSFAQTRRALDTLIAAFLWLHVPLIAAIALTSGQGAWTLAGLGAAIAASATAMRLLAHGARVTRLTMATAFIGIVSAVVAALAGSAWQVDLHMYYFVAMAVLAAYCDAGVIATAALVTALHHLVLNFLLPALVFPGGSNLDRVTLHVALVLLEAGALVWMTQRIAAAFRLSAAALAQSQADRVALAAKTARAEMLLQNNLRLRVLSNTDGLTGIGNRRYLDEGLAGIWRENTRTASPVGMLLMDVDHFKTFNDRYGHQVGDRCLRLIADLLSHMIRHDEDILARFGGEEFALVMPHAAADRVHALGERIRHAVQELRVPLEVSNCQISISIGCASIIPLDGVAPATLITAADTALYCAKAAGRNCVHPVPIGGEAA